MRHTMILASALALWAAPAFASHIVPRTFATTPADPPAAAAPKTAPAHRTHSVFTFYTPMPAGPAQAQTAQGVSTRDPLSPQMTPRSVRNPNH